MIKSYTDLSQSKKLAEILPLESADMFYRNNGIDVKLMWEHNAPKVGNPCWSLAALLGVLPILERKGYQKAKPRLLYNVAINKWIVDSHIYTTDAYDNPVDACYEMILKLHELKIL